MRDYCTRYRTDSVEKKDMKRRISTLQEGLMVNLLWNIRLQERQKLVRPGNIGCSMAALDGGHPRSGNRFGRVVLREFRGKVGGEDGSLGRGGGGVLLYDADVIIGCLKSGERKRVPDELRGWRDVRQIW